MAAPNAPVQYIPDVSDSEIAEASDSDMDFLSDDEDKESFRMMDLPGELRLRIWGMVLGARSRISLDPKAIRNPGAFFGTRSLNYDIKPLLLVSKAVYNEVLPLLYSIHTFCLIEPSAKDDALNFVGPLALSNIRKLEVKVKYGLVDLGAIWDDLTLRCIKMKELKLVFYHEKNHWLDMFADLALMVEPKPKLDLQLYSSIWSEPNSSAAALRTKIDKAFESAERRAKVIKYSTLPKVTLITVAASVSGDTAYAFLTYQRNNQAVFEANTEREGTGPARTCLRWKA